MKNPQPTSLYIAMFSIHGLVRGENMELGRDADTGGQVKYVVELARALSRHPRVDRVDLLTRRIEDPKVSPDYAEPEEELGENARIVRLPCGPRRYLRKEVLWPHLNAYADEALKYFRRIGKTPDFLHGHYADAGYVASKLSYLLGIPMIFTGHSMGRVKLQRLLDKGLPRETINKRYNINTRIEAEELALSSAARIITSTSQEAREQYAVYQNYNPQVLSVVPPGADLEKFHPPRRQFKCDYEYEIARFLRDPKKPMILAISRADERKNIAGLIDAYAKHPNLRSLANLVIVAGNRDDIQDMDPGTRDTLNGILLRIDKYDLYGRAAFPKHHKADDIPDIYRLAARTKGVFVNPALTEPFGLTLIEAAASGLPIVATNDGGPKDIIGNCSNGTLIDPLDPAAIGEAVFEIVHNPARWQELSRNGLRGVKKHYSWDSHTRSYLQCIQKFARKRKRKPFWITSGKKLLKSDRFLVTDIDNTLIGDDNGLREFIGHMRDWRPGIGFGIATGRSIDSAIAVLKKSKVPMPDILITSVGAEIHYGHNLEEDTDWSRHIHYKWAPDKIRELMEQYPGVMPQHGEDQRRHKVSFYVDTAKAPRIREIVREIRRRKIAAKTIFSRGQYLDFLPQRASKGLAVWYVANKWGIPMDHVLVAGDSGNDEEMLTMNVLGVVVGNYAPELENLRGNAKIYFASKPFALGILEGIDYFNFYGDIRIPEGDGDT